MFTKDDLSQYCSDLLNMENKMESVYQDLAARLSHVEHKEFFEQLAREEQEHASKVDRLLEILAAGAEEV